MKVTSDGIFSTHYVTMSMIKRPVKLPGFRTNAIINVCLFFPPLDGCLYDGELEEGGHLRGQGQQCRSTSAASYTMLCINATAVRKGGWLLLLRFPVVGDKGNVLCSVPAASFTGQATVMATGMEPGERRTEHSTSLSAWPWKAWPQTPSEVASTHTGEAYLYLSLPLLRFSEAYCIHKIPQEAMSGKCHCVRWC